MQCVYTQYVLGRGILLQHVERKANKVQFTTTINNEIKQTKVTKATHGFNINIC